MSSLTPATRPSAPRTEIAARTAAPSRRIGRRVWAVVAGLLVNVIGASAVDAVLHATGVYPAPGASMADSLFALALAYRIVFGVLGCYVTARLAPDRPMQHALALATVGVAIGTTGAIVMRGLGPLWYPLAVIAITFPAAWIGARLRIRQLGAA